MDTSSVEALVAERLRERHGSLAGAFLAMDGKRDSAITPEELRIGLQKYGLDLDPSVIAALVEKYDTDSSGGFQFQEFAKMYNSNTMPMKSSAELAHASLRPGSATNSTLSTPRPVTLDAQTSALLKTVSGAFHNAGTTASEALKPADWRVSSFPTYGELRYALSRYGVHLSASELVQLAAAFDFDFNGTVDVDALAHALGEDPQMQSSVDLPPTLPAGSDQLKDKSMLDVVQDTAKDSDVIRKICNHLEERRMQLKSAFAMFDKSGHGTISLDDFVAGLAEVGVSISPAHAQHLMDKYDINREGRLHYFEFVRMLSSTHAEAHGERESSEAPGVKTGEDLLHIIGQLSSSIYSQYNNLKKGFASMDVNGDGQLSPQELQRGLQHIDLNVTLEEAEEIVKAYDRDNSGKLRYAKFVNMLAASAPRI